MTNNNVNTLKTFKYKGHVYTFKRRYKDEFSGFFIYEFEVNEIPRYPWVASFLSLFRTPVVNEIRQFAQVTLKNGINQWQTYPDLQTCEDSLQTNLHFVSISCNLDQIEKLWRELPDGYRLHVDSNYKILKQYL